MDTHFLDAFLSNIFLLLKAPASTSELREHLTAAAGLAAEEVAPEQLSAALESLAKAGLIENSSL
jgi:PqqD family protein of HPr-rel-A system